MEIEGCVELALKLLPSEEDYKQLKEYFPKVEKLLEAVYKTSVHAKTHIYYGSPHKYSWGFSLSTEEPLEKVVGTFDNLFYVFQNDKLNAVEFITYNIKYSCRKDLKSWGTKELVQTVTYKSTKKGEVEGG